MTSRTLVMKFGGTSVGTAEAVRQTASIVASERARWPRVVVVASALAGVTNALLSSAAKAAAGDDRSHAAAAQQLREDHAAILETLVPMAGDRQEVVSVINGLVREFSDLCHAICILGEATPRALDAVAGLGERMSVRVLSCVLRSIGVPSRPVDATDLIVTDDRYQARHPLLPRSPPTYAAHPDLAATRVKTQVGLLPVLEAGEVPVVTGFIAATPAGVMTTLGRGGGDYSAALLAAALPADEMWDWTDVDGVMTCDPRLVKEARTIDELSYREVAELAYFGAKVLHPKTIRPVVDAGVGLRVCNTFHPDHPGTRIVPQSASPRDGSIKAVTAIREQCIVNIEGRGMLGVPGVSAKAFGAVAATGVSVQLITQSSSEQSICFAVPAASAQLVVERLRGAFAAELQRNDIDRVWASPEVTIVTVVGAGMIRTPGIAGRIFTALGERNVNVMAIAQGSSEVSVSFVVDAQSTTDAIRAIHELI
eukprot:m51a1_g9806 putative aspartate kinase (482) ;mRNA; f:1817529-1819363